MFNKAVCLLKTDSNIDSNEYFKKLIDNNQDSSLASDCLLNIAINYLIMNKEKDFESI